MTQSQKKLLVRITQIDGLMSGRPVIRGLRFPVADILELLASGMTDDEILNEHPILEKEDIKAALLFSALKINEDLVYE
jgi:uncharacterized protein (DUF433 family)